MRSDGVWTMNVSLTPELEKLIQDKVQSGMYYSASEVIREALRLLQEHDELRQQRLQASRERIRRGMDQLDRGESIEGEEFFDNLKRKSEKRRRKRA